MHGTLPIRFFGRTENFLIPPLEAGETKEVPYIVQLPARLGTWRATATADVNQEVTEAYEDNNVMEVDFTVAAP